MSLTSRAWPDSARRHDPTEWRDRGRQARTRDEQFALAREVIERVGVLRAGNAGAVFASLAALGAADVTLARVVEPHLDARSILAQAGVAVEERETWGVFAAEAADARLEARETPHGHRLVGTKPWCSLASQLTSALVTAHTPTGRQLFRVTLTHPGVTTHDDQWRARGMPTVPSAAVDFDEVPAEPVGAPGWYLERPGFAWGGIGVAACWWGGAVGLVERLRTFAERHAHSDLALAAYGRCAADLSLGEHTLADAAARIDAGEEVGPLLAQRVRSSVRAIADRVLATTTAALGPAPATAEPDYIARVADLQLYLLQDHGERDLARLGRLQLEDPEW